MKHQCGVVNHLSSHDLIFTQAQLFSEDFTHAETNAMPNTPSLMLGSKPLFAVSEPMS
jgi:hypothetical protein